MLSNKYHFSLTYSRNSSTITGLGLLIDMVQVVGIGLQFVGRI